MVLWEKPLMVLVVSGYIVTEYSVNCLLVLVRLKVDLISLSNFCYLAYVIVSFVTLSANQESK